MKRDFRLNEEEIQKRIERILESFTVVQPATKVNLVKDDPDDNKIIEAAIAANAEYIISGDPDLYKLKEVNGIKILTPKEFLDRFQF